MRCMLCKGHATFDQTVFQGAVATKVRLCDPCAAKVNAQEHMAQIRGAPDHQTKTQAVAAFLKKLGK